MLLKNLLFVGFCVISLAGVCVYVAPQEPAVDLAISTIDESVSEDFRDVVGAVNREFRQSWQSQGLEPAPRATDLAIARRLALSLTGSIPSIEDLRLFTPLPASRRIPTFAANLLADRRHSDYFAERLARAYVGVDDGPFLVYRRRRFVNWLSDQVQDNVPYDVLVRQLITADGLWTDSPEVNFLTVNMDGEEEGRPDPIRLAGRTTRAFLGVRLDCVQCHDDNLNGEWLQSDFHELAAFYSDPASSLVGIRDKRRDYEYQYLNAEDITTVTPSVPMLDNATDAIPLQGKTRREQLAGWVTHPRNQAFARAIVNRVWALSFGRPLVEPLDSIPLEGPYPPGLETLAEDFIRHGCDLRRLWRVIIATEVFQLDSRADFEVTTSHEDAWAAFPVTRLRPEQVAGAIIQAAKLNTIDADSHIFVRLARSDGVNKFVTRYGDMGQDEFDQDGGTIPQRLVMLNGNLIKEVTRDELLAVTNATARIAAQARSDADAIDAAYLAVLTRRPSDEEQQYFLRRLAASSVSRAEFFEDLYWTLFNSTEFSWNH